MREVGGASTRCAAIVLLLLSACAVPRTTRSSLETLVGALPLSSAAQPEYRLTYFDLRAHRASGVTVTIELPLPRETADAAVSDGVWTAVGGGAISKADAGGAELGAYAVNETRGLAAKEDFVLAGPPSEIRGSLEWLADASRSALAEPGLRGLVRALGEPGRAAIEKAPEGCGPRWVATAEKFATIRQPQIGVWVYYYLDEESPARDVERIRDAVARRPPPGTFLQVDLRPGHVVVQFRGSGGDPAGSFCR